MKNVVPMRPQHHRLVIRVVCHPKVTYRTAIIQAVEERIDLSYRVLCELFEVKDADNWFEKGCKTYREARVHLEEQTKAISDPIGEGLFVTVWPRDRDVFIRDLIARTPSKR